MKTCLFCFFFQKYQKILKDEKSRLFDTIRNINTWEKQNYELTNIIENIKLQNFKISMITNDEKHGKNKKFTQIKFKSIMKRNKIVKKIQDNYGILLALQAQLELLRLKTYPTLRLNKNNIMS